MSILLLPGSTDNWISPGVNQRRFVKFPAGDFAFLVSVEAEIGEFQSCALFSPMNKFSTQSEATLTARASLVGLLSAPPSAAPPVDKAVDKPALSRRRFFAMR
jgi:[NiFe] hydrogenase assembly HybE family chaperone